MARTIPYCLEKYPEHAAIIGRILLAYGDVEANMIGLVAMATDGSIDTGLRLLYRLRSEANRLDIADAVLRPFFDQLGLPGPYSQWLGAMRWCKKARNQYAHSLWDDIGGHLRLADLDTAAALPEGRTVLTFSPITIELLKEQEDFFHYVDDLMHWMTKEARFLRDRRRRHATPRPKARKLPSLDSHLG